jgi:hypothetical protein
LEEPGRESDRHPQRHNVERDPVPTAHGQRRRVSALLAVELPKTVEVRLRDCVNVFAAVGAPRKTYFGHVRPPI